MRICILQTLHTPLDKRVFHKEAKSLAAAGHEVVSVAPSETPLTETSGVRFIRIPTSRSLGARAINALRLIPIAWRIPTDVYLCIDPEAWAVGVAVGLLKRRKVVFDMHEYYPADLARKFPGPFRGATQWLFTKIMRTLARLTDHVILSKSCIDFVFEGLRVPRTVVLNTNHLQPVCTDVPQHLREKYAGRPTIIHEGDFGVLRGAYQLLDAMKILIEAQPAIKCVILGNWDTGDKDAYLRAIREAGMEDHIDMVGLVPFEEVPAYIAAAKLGLILFQPSHGIPHRLIMPHKMFDYMREAKPFITTDYPIEIKRIVEANECAVVVDVSDPKAIAEGILRLLNSPEEAERLGRNGRRLVEEEYNWGKDEARLLGVFKSLARED